MLSIIIVNFKNPPLLRLCLQSLARNFAAHHTETADYFPYEVIVVDSASSVETRNIVQEEFHDTFSAIHLVPFTENTGYTRGVNEGIKKSTGAYVLILNPDIVVLEGAIEKIHEYMENHPDVGILGPRLYNFDDSIQSSCFRFFSPLTILYRRINHLPFARHILSSFLMEDTPLDSPLPVDWVMGSALMVRTESIRHIGIMDQQFFLYLSEVDWARRFWENGYAVVYFPTASFYHYHRRESKGRFGILDVFFKRETRWHIADAVRYFRKHGIMPPPAPAFRQAKLNV